MTLIVEIYDTALEESVYLADCLVSSDDKRALESKFPIHFGANTGICTIGREVVSKALTRKDRIILCSGERRNIENMAGEFVRIQEGDLEGFRRWMDFYRSEKKENKQGEGFIYSIPINGQQINSSSYAWEFPFGNFRIFYAGSGGDLFASIFCGASPPANAEVNVISVAAYFLGALTRRDMISDEPAKKGFGGAYELFGHGSDGFVRIPYTILDWKFDTFMDNEGVHNIDRSTMSLERIIEAPPMPRGTVFMVHEMTSDSQTHVVAANEIGQKPISKNDIHTLVSKSLDASWSPCFTMILLRGDNLNYMVTNEKLISYAVTDSGQTSFSVDMSLVYRLVCENDADRNKN